MGYRRSSVPNLYRDERTQIYYVRTKVHGRTIWKTLHTNEFRVAKLRAPKELGDLQKGRNALSSLEKGSATFGNLAELYRVRIQSDTRLKPSSKIYRCQTIDAILRFRPEWNEKLIRDIRETDCLRWAAAYSGKVHGTCDAVSPRMPNLNSDAFGRSIPSIFQQHDKSEVLKRSRDILNASNTSLHYRRAVPDGENSPISEALTCSCSVCTEQLRQIIAVN